MGERESIEIMVARIETKLDEVLKKLTDHESRIRKIENNMWKFIGICSSIAFIVALLFKAWK